MKCCALRVSDVSYVRVEAGFVVARERGDVGEDSRNTTVSVSERASTRRAARVAGDVSRNVSSRCDETVMPVS